jgi:hypothetical protein
MLDTSLRTGRSLIGQTTKAAEDKPDRKVAVRECTASADGAIRVLGLKE